MKHPSLRLPVMALVFLLAGTVVSGADYRVARAYPVASEPACMPALTRAPNGDLLLAFSTEWEPFPQGGTLKLMVSRDEGTTWSEPRVLWKDPDPRVTIQVANGMQTLRNGDVLLPVTYCLVPKRKKVPAAERQPSKIYDVAAPGYRREVRLLRSKDSGTTWSFESPPLPKPWFRFGRLLETTDGRLLMSGDAWFVESRDLGKTWSPPVAIDAASGFNETNVVQAGDGSLLALMRQDGELGTRRMFGISYSGDGGTSWSRWRWAGVQGKMPDLALLPSGRLLLAVGAEGLIDGGLVLTTPERRSFCTLFISDDHGKSWRKDVEFASVPGQDAIVPADSPVMIPFSDGRILVILQAIDRSQKDHPLLGYSAGMSLIANLLEPQP